MTLHPSHTPQHHTPTGRILKTLVSALALVLASFAALSGPALAQDDTTDTTTQDDSTTQDDTTTQNDTTTDTGTDTTTDTGTDTTTTESTDTTTTESTGTTTTESTDTTTTSGTTDSTTDAGQGTGIAAAFEETPSPNPQPGAEQPGQPAAPVDGAAAAAPTADQVLGESQLAFTGPDVRIAALAMVLLGAGALTMIASRRHEDRFANSTGWIE